ncbi:Sjogren's syndrome/scleroderma autoantigen 1 (Autoantigen p27) [uncultured archaeon]|nr:Sjogren's syndrome/scleroderma autoantigen 1 (Autoantigen p27) [uncultured archaeon]
MNEKETNDKLQRITKLLEIGGTMLANHHECGAPMFRYQGKIVCPVCDFQEKPEPPRESKRAPESQKAAKTQKSGQEPEPVDLQFIKRIILTKIHEITTSLEDETDLHRMKDKLDCIEQGIKILKLMQE